MQTFPRSGITGFLDCVFTKTDKVCQPGKLHVLRSLLPSTPLSFDPNLRSLDGLPRSSEKDPLDQELRTVKKVLLVCSHLQQFSKIISPPNRPLPAPQ